MKKIGIYFLSIILFILLSSCASISKIPNLPEYIKKIAIPTFINKTSKFGIESTMTDYVIREFLKDGRLKVVRKEDADAILEGEIVNYVNEVLQYDVSYVPIQYRLKIDVNIKFIDAKTNQVLFVQEKVGALSGGTATYFVRPDVGFDVKTEFEAQKEIYEKLAKYIVNRVIYGWEKPFER